MPLVNQLNKSYILKYCMINFRPVKPITIFEVKFAVNYQTKPSMLYSVRRLSSFLILLFCFACPATGPLFGMQPDTGPSPRGVISGRVVESVSHQPLEYVNVVVYHTGGSGMVTGGITEADGTFRIDGIPRGAYDISVSFIGFETSLIGEVNVDPASAETHLGTIELTPGEEMMEAVTVTAEREMLVLNLDKMVFAVDRDMTATGGSALDIMESIPSVSVDYDGRISLRGNTNVTIWVDGRPSHLESLDQLPATMIERVEVITNPSARHDPDGTSGIINVIMKRQRQPGTNGMLSFNMGTGNKYNGSVHLNHRADRFNFFGNWDYRRHGMEGYNLNDRNIITGQGDTLRQLGQHEEFFRRGVFNNFRVGTDFFISPGNTLTFFGAFNLRDTRPQNFSEVNLFLPAGQKLSTAMERQFKGFGREYVLNYTRNGNDNGRQFTADLFYSASTGETFRNIRVAQSASPADSELRYAEAYTPGRLITLQADYVHPFGEQSRFEAGQKASSAMWRTISIFLMLTKKQVITQQTPILPIISYTMRPYMQCTAYMPVPSTGCSCRPDCVPSSTPPKQSRWLPDSTRSAAYPIFFPAPT